MSLVNLNPPTLEDFLSSIQNYSFQQKFYKWESYLQKLKISQSQYYQAILEKFVEYYPFNHNYWSQICDLAIKVPKTGKNNAVRLYQLGLTKNPRSITLWFKYLSWLKKEICRSDPGYLRKQYDRATKIIGNHYKAAFIFENYFQIQPSCYKKYQVMKKALVTPLEDLDKIYDLIQTYLANSEDFTFEILRQLADEQRLPTTESDPQRYQKQVRQLLIVQMRKLYEPTKQHVEKRYQFESKLSLQDEYKPFSGNIEVWRNYISFIKYSGNPDFLCPIYERALITNCDNQSLWQQYFVHLQAESDYHNRALYLLRSHSTFFRSFSRQLTYYWVQFEERQNHVRSRQLYLELERTDPNLDVFLRHIQMQIRYKQFLNARVLYQTILTTFTSNVNIISFVIFEYTDLCLKYFRDTDAKKMLRNYFQSFPFSERMFFGLLQFYIKNVQLKENNKDNNETYEQFTNILTNGLKRALQNCPEDYKTISKIAKKYLRDYVPSIFLLKKAERKIKQMEINFNKESESPSKRVLEQSERVSAQDMSNNSPSKHRS